MVRRYERLMNSAAQEVYRTARLSGLAQTTGTAFMQFTSFAVAAIGSLLVLSEDLTVGGLSACTMLAGRALQPLLRAMGIWTHFQAIRVAHDRLVSLFDTPLEPGYGGTTLSVRGGEITLDQVRFAYDARRPVITGVSLNVHSGEVIGITGGNGSGKSTLLQLISGTLARTRAPSRSTASRSPVRIARATPTRSATCRSTACCSRARSSKTSRCSGAASTSRRRSGSRTSSASTSTSRGCPTATTRS